MASTYVISVRVDTASTAEAIDRMSSNLRRVQRDGERAQHFLVRMTQAIVGSAIVRELYRVADAYQNMQNRIGNVAGANSQTYGELFSIAQRTRTSVESTVQIYQRVANAVSQFGYTSRNTISFVEGLNKLVAYSGANAIEANAAIIQLSQGLGAGALRGEELNSVFEQIPELMRIVARNLGVTTGQLRAMAKQGKLTADVIMSAVRTAGDEIDAKFGKSLPTLGQRVIQVKNAFIDWFGKMGQSSGLFSKLDDGLIYIRDHLDGIMRVARLLGELLIGATIAKGITLVSRAVLGLMTALALNPFGTMIKGIVLLLPLIIDLAGGFKDLVDAISKWATEPGGLQATWQAMQDKADPSGAATRKEQAQLAYNQFFQQGVFGGTETPNGTVYADPIAYAAGRVNQGDVSSQMNFRKPEDEGWLVEQFRDPDLVAKAYFDALTEAMEANASTGADRSAKIIMDMMDQVAQLNGQHNLDLIDNVSATIGDVTAKAVADQTAAAKEAEKAAKRAREEWKAFVKEFDKLRDTLNPLRGALNDFFKDYQTYARGMANADRIGFDPNAAPSGLLKYNDSARLPEIGKELDALRLTPSEELAIVVGAGGEEYLVARRKLEGQQTLLAERASILKSPYAAATGFQTSSAEELGIRTTQYDLELSKLAEDRGLFNVPGTRNFEEDAAEIERKDKELADAWASFDEAVSSGTEEMIDEARKWREEWERARDPLEGLKQGWAEFSVTVNDAAGDMKKAFLDAVNGINDAIVSLVVNGEASLKKLVDGVLSDLVTALLHAGEASIFKSLELPGFTDEPVGFARGGAAKVAGAGSTDSSLVSLRTTPGEVVQVHRNEGDYARQAGGGGGDVIIQNTWSPGVMLSTMGSRSGRREIRNSNEIDLVTLAAQTRAASARRR